MLFRHKREGLATQILLKLEAPLKSDESGLPDLETLRTSPLAVKEDEARPMLSDESVKQLKALGYLE